MMNKNFIYCCCCKYNLKKIYCPIDQKENRKQKLFNDLYAHKKKKSEQLEQLIKKLKSQN